MTSQVFFFFFFFCTHILFVVFTYDLLRVAGFAVTRRRAHDPGLDGCFCLDSGSEGGELGKGGSIFSPF